MKCYRNKGRVIISLLWVVIRVPWRIQTLHLHPEDGNMANLGMGTYKVIKGGKIHV